MVEQLNHAVNELLSIDVDELPNGQLSSAVVDVRREIERLEAVEARFVSEWEARRLWADDGSKAAHACFRRRTGVSSSTTKRVVHHACRLRTMPLTTAAYEAGDLSSDRTDLLVRANKPKVADLFARDEEMLLSQVQGLRFDEAVQAVEYWSQQADEATSESKAQAQIDGRYLNLVQTFEKTYDIQGNLDSIRGEIVDNELRRLERQMFEADWAEAKAIYGDETRVEHLKRTPQQRRADALVEMAKRSRSADRNSSRPLFTVFAGEETFARICELANGTVITPGQLVPWLAQADIERIIFDGPNRVMKVGHKRPFTGALRRAIEVRDKHCQDLSECDEPAERCDVDHIVSRLKGGITVQENGQLLCGKHNRAKGTGPP